MPSWWRNGNATTSGLQGSYYCRNDYGESSKGYGVGVSYYIGAFEAGARVIIDG